MKKIAKFFRAFKYASRGFVSALKERNMRFHFVAAILVTVAGFYFNLNNWEWIIIIILMGIVLSAEMVNTALEELANIVRDELKLSYSATTRARDVAAGAVLVLAIVAAIIGLIIFLPKMGLIS
jgi:undecaprenol kinase